MSSHAAPRPLARPLLAVLVLLLLLATLLAAPPARAAEVLPRHSFDLVYTGIGALNWVPSIERWADAVAALLAPGGRLFVRDGHPMLSAIDEEAPGELVVRHPYFETAEPMVFSFGGTYVETDRPTAAGESHEWNHGLGEIVTALLRHGLRIHRAHRARLDRVATLALAGAGG